jgi:phage terminase large subunit-like protein
LTWLATEAPSGARAYVFAGDESQAGLLADAAAGFVQRSEALQSAVSVQALKLIGRSGATVEVRAADGGGAFGLRPWLTIADELANWEDVRRLRRVWSAVVSGAHKVPGSRLVVLSSAGEPSHWSYKVLEEARRSPYWRVSETPGPLPWVRAEDLDAQRPLLMPSEFARLHLNQWTAAEDRLVTAEDLAACTGHTGPLDPVPGVRYCAGLDLGLKRDRSVLSVCHANMLPTGRVVVLDRQFVWQGSRLRPVDLAEVQATCLHVAEKYRGCSFVFDPWQSAQLSQNLKARRVPVTEYTFSQQSIGRLARRLFLLLSEHALDLPADDPELLAELANVRIRETSPGTFRLDHDASGHDDRAVSLALAANELLDQVPHRAPKMKVYPRDVPATRPWTPGPNITWVPGLFGARETGPKDWWGAK